MAVAPPPAQYEHQSGPLESGEGVAGEYTKDGTVDLKGNPVLRSKRGGWRACLFVVVYEVFERMAYYGIASNLVIYLTRKLRQGTVASANNVTNWVGTVWMTPVLGAYIADAHLGRYWTFVIASCIYLSGMILLTLSVSIPGLKPPSCTAPTDPGCAKEASHLQLGVFFFALYVLTVGTGGTKPNISTIGADQFDDFHPKEKEHKLSFFNWWMFSIFLGTLFANTVLIYIQDNVGWTLGYALPALGLAVSVAIFLAGTRYYRHKPPAGSPFTKMARVIVAALRNWRVQLPSDPKELYDEGYERSMHRKMMKNCRKNGTVNGAAATPKAIYLPIQPTTSLSFLNKASVKTPASKDSPPSPWRLCPITHVEETKQILLMIPILVATFVPSVMLAQINTLFIKQGTTLDRRMGPNFKIPPACLTAFVTISMLVSVVLYDRYFVPFMRRFTGDPRGITLLQRIAVGTFIHIIIMAIASGTERHRLNEAKKAGVVDSGGQVPLTIFTLLPQFVLMGVADAFLEVGKIEFFYDQAPESMKSLGTSFAMTTLGVGNFLSSFMLSTADKITKKDGGGRNSGWIRNNLNASHLDYYYAFFCVLNILNFLFLLLVSHLYQYRVEVGVAPNSGTSVAAVDATDMTPPAATNGNRNHT